MGVPDLLIEKLVANEPYHASKVLEQLLSRNFTGLMSAEIGGLNGLENIVLSAQTGLPVIDADSLGRAYPLIS